MTFVLPVTSVIDGRVWESLTPDSRGSWGVSDLGWGKAKRYRDTDILVAEQMIDGPELGLFVALVQSCEGYFSTGPTGGDHDIDRIRHVMGVEPDYGQIAQLIETISGDMLHVGASRAVDVAVSRRFLRPITPPKRSEQANLDPSEWLLFLNADYEGGELVFPGRRRMIRPRAGTIVRWPCGIPHGIATAHLGYQFTMSGRSI